MRGRITATMEGVEVKSRIYNSSAELYLLNESFVSLHPAAIIDIIPDELPAGVSQDQYFQRIERLRISEWFGSITVGIADKLTKKRFGKEATQISFDQVKTLWQELGKPKTFKIHRAIQFLNQAST